MWRRYTAVKDNPTISIIMSVYNGEQYLRKSIESILNQTFSDFEFIIINDGSSDRTPEILSDYERKDKRVRVFNQSNMGLTVSLNHGIAYAKGKYIARMDCGDISMPTRIEKQLQYLVNNEKTGIVGTHFSYINDDGKITNTVYRPVENGFLKWLLLFYNPIPNALAMFRLDLANRIGGYDLRYRYAQDYDFLCRISEVTDISLVPEVLFLVRKAQKEDISSKYHSEQTQLSLQTSIQMIENLIKKRPSPEIVHTLKYNEIPNIQQAKDCVALIIDLYRSFLANKKLNRHERNMIKKDSARMLWNVSRPNLKSFSMWHALLYSCSLDKYYAKALVRAFTRKMNIIIQ